MPRTQRGYGRPGTTVIPPDWSTSHAPVAAGTMPDRVSLRVPSGTGGWNETAKRTEATPNAPFATSVPARITALAERRGAGAEQTAVDDLVRVAGYLVALPLTASGIDQIVVDGENDTLIDVTTSADPLLAGKTLRVADIVRGSSRFERDLLCTLND